MMVASPTRDRIVRPLIEAMIAAGEIEIQIDAREAAMAVAVQRLLEHSVRALIGDEHLVVSPEWGDEYMSLPRLKIIVASALQEVDQLLDAVPGENEVAYLTEYGPFDVDDEAVHEMQRYAEAAYLLTVEWIEDAVV